MDLAEIINRALKDEDYQKAQTLIDQHQLKVSDLIANDEIDYLDASYDYDLAKFIVTNHGLQDFEKFENVLDGALEVCADAKIINLLVSYYCHMYEACWFTVLDSRFISSLAAGQYDEAFEKMMNLKNINHYVYPRSIAFDVFLDRSGWDCRICDNVQKIMNILQIAFEAGLTLKDNPHQNEMYALWENFRDPEEANEYIRFILEHGGDPERFPEVEYSPLVKSAAKIR